MAFKFSGNEIQSCVNTYLFITSRFEEWLGEMVQKLLVMVIIARNALTLYNNDCNSI